MSQEENEMTAADRMRQQAKNGDPNYGLAFSVEQGGNMYAPSRDFAYNYPRMITTIINCFSQNYWPELYESYLELFRVSKGIPAADFARGLESRYNEEAFTELEKAKDVYCAFINEAHEDKAQGCTDALGEVGWGDVPTPAQVTWLAMLGQVVTGQLFQGIRDMRREDGTKSAEIEELLEAGHDARRFMNGVDASEEKRADVEQLMRSATKRARAAGLSFDEIEELVADVKYGRVPNES